jgi:hypothetical protein
MEVHHKSATDAAMHIAAAAAAAESVTTMSTICCLQDDMEVLHNRAIDQQLQQLYHALGLALALNRTLLMPAMSCFCARGWYPNDACRLPGDKLSRLPFRCAGDQVCMILLPLL